jgi:ABC-2 type transport system permease protein
MKVLATLTLTEIRLFLREPLAVFFALAFPAILIGILGIPRGFREPQPHLGGARVVDLYVTISITLVIAMVSCAGCPPHPCTRCCCSPPNC